MGFRLTGLVAATYTPMHSDGSLNLERVAAVRSTYNYLVSLNCRMIEAFGCGDVSEAHRCQTTTLRLIEVLLRYRGNAGLKAAMSLVGLDCGPTRLSQVGLRPEEVQQMQRELDAAGFQDARGTRP